MLNFIKLQIVNNNQVMLCSLQCVNEDSIQESAKTLSVILSADSIFIGIFCWVMVCNFFLYGNECSSSGRKIEDPELLEAIRLTIINNLLEYHPVFLLFFSHMFPCNVQNILEPLLQFCSPIFIAYILWSRSPVPNQQWEKHLEVCHQTRRFKIKMLSTVELTLEFDCQSTIFCNLQLHNLDMGWGGYVSLLFSVLIMLVLPCWNSSA